MALLLDTHAALWWWRNSPKLGTAAREAIATGASAVLVSAVSAVEVAIKVRIGKLVDFDDPLTLFPALMEAHRFESLAVTQPQALSAGILPGDHRDPFDRIIAAQALDLNLTVVTRDPAFAAFGCKVLW